MGLVQSFEKICGAVTEIATLPVWLILLTVVATSMISPVSALAETSMMMADSGSGDWFSVLEPLNHTAPVLLGNAMSRPAQVWSFPGEAQGEVSLSPSAHAGECDESFVASMIRDLTFFVVGFAVFRLYLASDRLLRRRVPPAPKAAELSNEFRTFQMEMQATKQC
mmetsp:Transcript_37708/g.99764  ORF Transcript_37708/g.99764 Transcript_37708/m.99764 type:complete len:166 (-) Transcript_37708:523-1020(-)